MTLRKWGLDASVFETFLFQNSGLQNLTLKGSKFSNNDFAKVCSLGHLTSLNLAESSKLTDDGLRAIASLSQLRKLNLASCMNITHQGIKNLSKLASLQRLNLGRCNIFRDNYPALPILAALTRLELEGSWHTFDFQTPSLLHLSIAGSLRIDNTAMEVLAGMTKLQHLNLDFCTPLTNDGIFCLSALVELTSLSLQGHVRDRSSIGCWTLAALQHMTNLAELNLADRQFLPLALLPMGQMTSVTMLNLRSCKVRSESDIQAISCLQRLRHLDLQACKGVTDASIQSICHLQQLTFLNLAKNRCLSNEAVDQLSSMTNLQHVEIEDCPNISEPALDELYVALPRLRTLRSNSIDREVIPARVLQGCRIVQN